MTKSHFTKTGNKTKAGDFPLFLHRTGQWAKKVRQKIHYFGTDKQKALERWLAEKDYLLAGRKPPKAGSNSLSVGRLVNLFLDYKNELVKTGELSQVTFDDYRSHGKMLIDHFGKEAAVDYLTPACFIEFRSKLAENINLVSLKSRIVKIRSFFNFAAKNDLLESPLPRIMGTGFSIPSRGSITRLMAEKEKLFSIDEIKMLLDHANPNMKAMLLLGVNCGFGNQDVSLLKFSNVSLNSGWIDFPRPKTGARRRCPLWPETVQALRESLSNRRSPKDDKHPNISF